MHERKIIDHRSQLLIYGEPYAVPPCMIPIYEFTTTLFAWATNCHRNCSIEMMMQVHLHLSEENVQEMYMW